MTQICTATRHFSVPALQSQYQTYGGSGIEISGIHRGHNAKVIFAVATIFLEWEKREGGRKDRKVGGKGGR